MVTLKRIIFLTIIVLVQTLTLHARSRVIKTEGICTNGAVYERFTVVNPPIGNTTVSGGINCNGNWHCKKTVFEEAVTRYSLSPIEVTVSRTSNKLTISSNIHATFEVFSITSARSFNTVEVDSTLNNFHLSSSSSNSSVKVLKAVEISSTPNGFNLFSDLSALKPDRYLIVVSLPKANQCFLAPLTIE
jgi:hypothetical protein